METGGMLMMMMTAVRVDAPPDGGEVEEKRLSVGNLSSVKTASTGWQHRPTTGHYRCVRAC